MKRPQFLGILAISALLLAACAENDPVSVLESYLQARIDSNLETLLSLSCADWEAQAIIEASSFESMNAELQGMSCRQSGQEGNYTVIECEGKIVTVYNGETREWDLGAFPYRMIQEGGDWKMCGYAESGE